MAKIIGFIKEIAEAHKRAEAKKTLARKRAEAEKISADRRSAERELAAFRRQNGGKPPRRERREQSKIFGL